MSELIIVEFEGAAGDPSTKLGMTKKVRLIGQDDSDTDSDPDFLKGQGLLIRMDLCAFPPEARGRRGSIFLILHHPWAAFGIRGTPSSPGRMVFGKKTRKMAEKCGKMAENR